MFSRRKKGSAPVLSETKRGPDDFLIRDVPQPYIDLAQVLNDELFEHLVTRMSQAMPEQGADGQRQFLKEHPTYVVGSMLELLLEPKGLTFDKAQELVDQARAGSRKIFIDLNDILGVTELGAFPSPPSHATRNPS